MIRQGKELRAARNWHGRSVSLWLIDHDARGERLLAAPLTFVPAPEGLVDPEPTVRLYDEAAQRLIDDLWEAGLRPTLGRQSEGVTAAQARHLEDMRAIVADRLKVGLPQAGTK